MRVLPWFNAAAEPAPGFSWCGKVDPARSTEFVRKWGGRGDEPGASTTRGAFTRTVGCHVSDRSRVQVFDVHGGLVDIHHVSGAGDLTGVSVGDAGDVWAADDASAACIGWAGR